MINQDLQEGVDLSMINFNQGTNTTIFKDEYLQLIEDKLGEGLSIESTFAELDIQKTTFYNWMKSDNFPQKESLVNAVKRGLAKSQAKWERIGLDQATGASKGNVIAWIFNMKNRFGWQDKREVELSGALPLVLLGSEDEDGEIETVDAESVETVEGDNGLR